MNDDSELRAVLLQFAAELKQGLNELAGHDPVEQAVAAIKALYAPKTVVGDDELRKQVTNLMGYGYEPKSKYEQIYEQAKAIVRKRDKPEYRETMYELADDEFAVLIVDEMMRLIQAYTESIASRREVEAVEAERRANIGDKYDRLKALCERAGYDRCIEDMKMQQMQQKRIDALTQSKEEA